MIVRYWNPVQEIETMSRQMDEVFNQLAETHAARKTTWTPATRLVDQGNSYQLIVHLPGVSADQLDVQASREAVVISGVRPQREKPEATQVLYDDVRHGSFRRVVYLPAAIQHQAIEADFRQGQLILNLPKVEQSRAKVVKVDLTSLAASSAPEMAPAANSEKVENSETDDVWAAEA